MSLVTVVHMICHAPSHEQMAWHAVLGWTFVLCLPTLVNMAWGLQGSYRRRRGPTTRLKVVGDRLHWRTLQSLPQIIRGLHKLSVFEPHMRTYRRGFGHYWPALHKQNGCGWLGLVPRQCSTGAKLFCVPSFGSVCTCLSLQPCRSPGRRPSRTGSPSPGARPGGAGQRWCREAPDATIQSPTGGEA